jgi:hypothetical protein
MKPPITGLVVVMTDIRPSVFGRSSHVSAGVRVVQDTGWPSEASGGRVHLTSHLARMQRSGHDDERRGLSAD